MGTERAITALAIARECRAMGLPCVLFATSAGPATHSRIPEVHLLESATDEEEKHRERSGLFRYVGDVVKR